MLSSKKCGVLVVGAKGAVATTLMIASLAERKKLGFDFRSPTTTHPVFSNLQLVDLPNITFGGWDISSKSYLESAYEHKVVPTHVVKELSEELAQLPAYTAVVARSTKALEDIISSNLTSDRDRILEYSQTVFSNRPFEDMVKSIQLDIVDFKERFDLESVVVVNLASVEEPLVNPSVFNSLESLRALISSNSPSITDAILYAYAALDAGCNYINFTPSVSGELPALMELAILRKVCISGKDGKSGQTLYKTILAPMLRDRALRLKGWYSTNILGNRDGLVLNNPDNVASKIQTKSGVLSSILGYDDFDHQVHIHYYKPRGDSKEAWDNIDFSGWFDVQMQMKINWLGDDSILAAPLVFDLIRLVSFSGSEGEYGVLPQLAVFYKKPYEVDEHDFFEQMRILIDHYRQYVI
jgi:myo-inositol-1-phosphate synthase